MNVLKEDNGFSPLHEAVEDNHFEVCKYLISHGANVNQITKNGLSAYDIAILNGQILLAEFLSKNHDLEIISFALMFGTTMFGTTIMGTTIFG